mmetsp:Transcript_122441/g.391488  ORF Transcript_122441/g.391488 Transcript_122441/m.391488 type:complete len:245 (-) Transcript_122441:331-1065(-)
MATAAAWHTAAALSLAAAAWQAVAAVSPPASVVPVHHEGWWRRYGLRWRWHVGRGRRSRGHGGQRPPRKRRRVPRRLWNLRRRHQYLGLHRRWWHRHSAGRHLHRWRRRRLRHWWLQLGRGWLHGWRGVRRRHWHDDLCRRRRWRLQNRDHLQVCRSGPGRHPVPHAEAQDLLWPRRLSRGARHRRRCHLHEPGHTCDDHEGGPACQLYHGSDRRPAAAAGADDHDAGAPEDVHVLGRPPLGDF